MTSLVAKPVNPFPVSFDIEDQDDQREALAKDLDIEHFLLDWVQPHVKLFDVAGSISDGFIERTIDGASILSVTLHDPRMALLSSGLLTEDEHLRLPTIDVNLDGLWFTLSDITKQGDDITMVFEDRLISELRRHNKFRKVSRGDHTRAQFIRMLLREVKRFPVRMYSPEIAVKQPIEAISKEDTKKLRRTRRGPGFAAHVKLEVTDVPGRNGPLNPTQVSNLEGALDYLDDHNAKLKLMICTVMCIMQESMAKTTATNGEHVGLYQQEASAYYGSEKQRRDVKHSTEKFYTQLRDSLKLDPSQSYANLVESVQHSGFPDKYKVWHSFAKEVVKAYGGAPTSVTRYKHYEFTRGVNGQKENTWDCALRLAKEVEWRAFVVSGTFYYVSEGHLFRSAPQALLSPGDDHGTDDINFTQRAGHRLVECTVSARASRWAIPPGTVVEVDEKFGPASGKWLVSVIHRPLFSRQCEITLKKPQKAKLEPAAGVVTRELSKSGVGFIGGRLRGGERRDRIVAAAEKAHKHVAEYHYSHARGGAGYPAGKWPSLFSAETQRAGMDCSAFVTMCYQAAGAPDPNGLHYNGQGYTGTLIANGRKTSKPQPGDLVFYGPGEASGGAPGHVGIYIGDGEVIEMGGTPGPLQLKVKYRSDFIGYYRYDLGPPVKAIGNSPAHTGAGGLGD